MAALTGAGAGTAFAGEETGNGKDTQGPAHANSICVFSGQNDTPDEPGPEGGRVQSYGQLVKQGLKSAVHALGSPAGGLEQRRGVRSTAGRVGFGWRV